jgi:hypothetical protein
MRKSHIVEAHVRAQLIKRKVRISIITDIVCILSCTALQVETECPNSEYGAVGVLLWLAVVIEARRLRWAGNTLHVEEMGSAYNLVG